ncbi:DUF389 domain-containing protein [Burkholderia sp. BE12]|uniref:DUF389 domain-containing protein n=1 Tax=Burkholderia sp. BE12 TaxID=2082394 RepID=UPI0018F8656B|nr:DUF389 domain-containing protein [Burkholderia sp. BE12]
MIHLRLVVPPERVAVVTAMLIARDDVTNLMHLPGAALRPAGDVVLCDVARETADDLLARLDAHDVGGSIEIGMMESQLAQRTASGGASTRDDADAVFWRGVETQAEQSVANHWMFHAFLTLAVALAAIAVKLDSAIVVIAAMVVSPDFGPVAAACVGTIRRGKRYLIVQGAALLGTGFALSVGIVAIAAFVGAWAGWFDMHDLLAPRPQTDFIWTPDRWSFVVALLAGAAGVLALTSPSWSNALVGVFIAVTTVPAAGNLALAIGIGLHDFLVTGGYVGWTFGRDTIPTEIGGSLAQLAVNVFGMVCAGIATLLATRFVDRRRAAMRVAA